VLNVLRSQSLPGVDFSQPAQVLAGLNRAFSMDQNNNMFFTLWFGVFRCSSRDLNYASGGHPPALLFRPVNADRKREFESLSTNGPAVGVDPDSRYIQQSARVAPKCSLVLYSDGVYEIQQTNGRMWSLDEFIQDISANPFPTLPLPQICFQSAMERHGLKPLDDDYSLLQIEIN
jgi:sigma-B regulation protein RsbU (phosphoserine phosphatase)